MLFDCLEIESGGYYFTTSDPQAALSTDFLMKARKRYFESLCHLYTGETLARKIIDGIGEYRYIGREPPVLKDLFPEGGEIIGLLEEVLIRIPSRDEADTILTTLDPLAELLRQIYTYFRSLEELDRFAQQQYGEKHPWAYEDLVRAYARKNNWQNGEHGPPGPRSLRHARALGPFSAGAFPICKREKVEAIYGLLTAFQENGHPVTP
ncbi:MAG: hypothetical protein HYS70_00965 [Nitrospinae bacterium]|nr:hypothetical protein [Nitrospinota bacterium]